MSSAEKWKTHTSTSEFATNFDHLTRHYNEDNELRSQKIEEFLIEEAKKAGVIKSTIVKT
jgi:hypothetical protein